CEIFFRQRFPGIDVTGDERQYLRTPGKVLHELARQLYCIPGDTVDACNARIIDARQHVVQPVAELMEHGDDFRVRQERRLRADGRHEVAHKVSNWQRGAAAKSLTSNAFIYPRAAAFLGAGVQVDEEATT